MCQGWGEIIDVALGALHTMDCPRCIGNLRCGLCAYPLTPNTTDVGTSWFGYWDGRPCPACNWNQDIGGPGTPPGCVCDFEDDQELPF
jgi:hypothetical protein